MAHKNGSERKVPLTKEMTVDDIRKQLPERDGDNRAEFGAGPILMEDLRPGDQAVILDSKGERHAVAITSEPVVRIVRKVSVEYSCPTLRNQGTTRDGFPVAAFVKHVPPVDISEDEGEAAAAALLAFSFDFGNDSDDS